MTDIARLLTAGSARAIGAAIAQGRTSATEVTKYYLGRIATLNGGAGGLNCVRTVSTQALEQALEADMELAAGRSRGPLHGLPYLVKDNVFTADGSPASAGSAALAGFLPPYEATLVGRLREAGAILLGKTNMTEFADFVSDVMPAEFSAVGGVVRNPLGPRYGRGQGSSVGSAAAVAARLCAFAIGTETQNSIQAPAVHSGIVGFKPTVGRISRHGVVPLVPSQDSPGPLVSCVDDAALVFEALAGADLNDTATMMVRDLPFAPISSLRGLRIGVLRAYATDALDPASRRAFEQTLHTLADAGAVLIDPCDFPVAERLAALRSSVFRTEFKASLNHFLHALRPCGLASLADIIAYNRANPEAIPYGQSLLEASNAMEGLRSAQYVEDRREDLLLSLDQGIRGALDAGRADVLLAPMSTAAKCSGKAGAPVIALPAGRDAQGFPFGVTLLAAPGCDRGLLQAAAAVESALRPQVEAHASVQAIPSSVETALAQQ